MVARILKGDQSAEVELYAVFSRGIRYQLARKLGAEELDDNLHNSFVTCLEAVRSGQLRQPERLMGFVRTVIIRKIAEQIHRRVRERSLLCSMDEPFAVSLSRCDVTPEHLLAEKERLATARAALARMPHRQREILTRFYILEQTKEQVCREMGLTETQFRLLKSRTKAKVLERNKELLGIRDTRRVSCVSQVQQIGFGMHTLSDR